MADTLELSDPPLRRPPLIGMNTPEIGRRGGALATPSPGGQEAFSNSWSASPGLPPANVGEQQQTLWPHAGGICTGPAGKT